MRDITLGLAGPCNNGYNMLGNLNYAMKYTVVLGNYEITSFGFRKMK